MRKDCLVEGCKRKPTKAANYCNACYKRLYIHGELIVVGNRDLTNRQQQIYDFMEDTLLREQFVPGPLVIAKHFGFRPNAAQCHIEALQAKGYVEIQRDGNSGKYRLPKLRLKVAA